MLHAKHTETETQRDADSSAEMWTACVCNLDIVDRRHTLRYVSLSCITSSWQHVPLPHYTVRRAGASPPSPVRLRDTIHLLLPSLHKAVLGNYAVRSSVRPFRPISQEQTSNLEKITWVTENPIFGGKGPVEVSNRRRFRCHRYWLFSF